MKTISRKLWYVLLMVVVICGMILMIPGTLFAAPNDLNLTSNVWGDSTQRNWKVTNSTAVAIDVHWVVVGTANSGDYSAAPGYSFFQTPDVGGPNTVKISWDAGASTKTKASENKTYTGTITATAGPGGTISPAGVFKNWELHAYYPTLPMTTTFTITPDPGYAISDVLVNGVSVGAVVSYDFIENGAVTGNANQTIEALFSALPAGTYNLWATTEGPGSITNPGLFVISPGQSLAYTITPDGGASISDVLVNGASVGAVSSYTFINVNSDQNIKAIFTTGGGGVAVAAITEGTLEVAAITELPRTGNNMLFYVIGFALLAVGVAFGSFFMSKTLRKREN